MPYLVPKNAVPCKRTPVRVLIVDRSRITANSLALVIRARGFLCRIVDNAEDALDLAPLWRADAAILDSVIGGTDGASLAVWMSRKLPSCKVLLTSANAHGGSQREGPEERGRNMPSLVKPFDLRCIMGHLDAIRDREDRGTSHAPRAANAADKKDA